MNALFIANNDACRILILSISSTEAVAYEYSIDFNLRPFGGFDMGSYDTDVSDQNWSSYLFGNVPPDYITYTDTVRCVYKKKQQFGYSDIDRIKIDLTYLKYEVKTYD